MALWQYTFQILPKEIYSILKDDVNLSSDDDLFDDARYWQYEPIDRHQFDEIGKILCKSKSWTKEIDLYGNLESNCLEVYYNIQSNNVCSVSFRIDFTSDFEIVLKALIEFCVLNGFVILDENYQSVPLNFETVKSILYNSQQIKRYDELSNKSLI